MENEKIKAIVKEAIEEDRKERSRQVRMAISDSLFAGTIGALVFVATLLIIVVLFRAVPFMMGFTIAVVAIIDAFMIRGTIQLNYNTNYEIEELTCTINK